jgi:6-phosphofructokinase 1
MQKIALITSGGDAPGMNACVRAIVKTAINQGIEVLGIQDGYQGMIEGRGSLLTFEDVDNIVQLGGTILGTARSKEFLTPEGRAKAIQYLNKEHINGLIVIGGDGSFAGATVLSEEMNIQIIGVPGTIDNDIYGTDHTIGFDSALNTVVSAVDKIRDTASSHHRVFFIEVMGRDAGFIALDAAIASGAEDVLIPEEHTDLPELVRHIEEANQGKRSTIIIVAEGDDAGGAIDIMNKVKPLLPNYEMRVSILGHIQRGGSPSAKDRIMATQMGSLAVNLLVKGKSKLMIGVQGEKFVLTPLSESIKLHSQPDLTKTELLNNLRTNSKNS